jgi:hypothetical protein
VGDLCNVISDRPPRQFCAYSAKPPWPGLTLKMPIFSAIRWPPDPGAAPTTGPNLTETYQHFFGAVVPEPPLHVTEQYEISNYLDCKMTADLWNRWRQRELAQGSRRSGASTCDLKTLNAALMDDRFNCK